MIDPFCFFKQKTAYEMRISDWSSDVCSSDLWFHGAPIAQRNRSSVASPRKVKKPMESVIAVRKMPLESAGSKPIRFSVTGINTPAQAARSRLQVKAAKITATGRHYGTTPARSAHGQRPYTDR